MKKFLSTLLLLVLTSGFMFAQNPPNREMRAVWLTTAWQLDWPSVTVPAPVFAADNVTITNEAAREQARQTQKSELISILDRLHAANFNAVFFQVRPMSDAFYRSSFQEEAWSQYISSVRGADPGWDPLEFIIAESHKRGMELHAWLNPFRYSSSDANFGNLPTDYAATHPEWLIHYGRRPLHPAALNTILNPGLPEVHQRIADIVEDIISRYNVDGIVFDDYFYIQRGLTYFSLTEYNDLDRALWQANNPLGLSQEDWRRANVNTMIRTVFERVQEVNPAVRFGVSPAGGAASDPAVAAAHGVVPSPVHDWQFTQIFSDPLAWLREGTVDYISPQNYVVAAYDAVVNWWANVTGKFYNQFFSSQNNFTTVQIENNRNRDLSGSPGSVFFRMVNLTPAVLNDFRTNVFQYPALVPAMSWKPAPVQGLVENMTLTGQNLSWTFANTNLRFAVYAAPRSSTRSPLSASYLQGLSYNTHFTLPAGISAATHRIGVAVVDRFGNQFAPRFLNEALTNASATSLISPANNAVVGANLIFSWSPVENAALYVWQISPDPDFSRMLATKELTDTQIRYGFHIYVRSNTTYYWRVKTLVENGGTEWSETRQVVVKFLPEIEDVEMRINAEGDVIQRSPMIITFSQRMNRASVENAISFSPAATVGFTWLSDFMVRIDISGLDFATDYTFTIDGSIARSAEGNYLAGDGTEGSDFVLNFRTRAVDASPPMVVSYDPVGVTNSARPIIRIEFDKPLNEATLAGNLSVIPLFGMPVIEPLSGIQTYYRAVNDKSVIHFLLNEDLIPGNYRVRLLAGIEDLYGNAMPENFEFTFSVNPREVELITVLDDFNTLSPLWMAPSWSGSTLGINAATTVASRSTQVLSSAESTGSVRLNYQWLPTVTDPRIRWHFNATAPKFSRDNVIQYYLFGDGSNTQVAVVLRVDGGGDMWRHRLITLDWVGWRQITWDMANDPVENFLVGSGSQLPAGNVLNLSCFAVLPAPMAERSFDVSSIYFSRLRVVRLGNYINHLDEVPDTSGIKIYNTNNHISVSASSTIRAIHVYSLVGALIKSVQPEQLAYQIPTTNLAQGVYVLRVETANSQRNVRVVVR